MSTFSKVSSVDHSASSSNPAVASAEQRKRKRGRDLSQPKISLDDSSSSKQAATIASLSSQTLSSLSSSVSPRSYSPMEIEDPSEPRAKPSPAVSSSMTIPPAISSDSKENSWEEYQELNPDSLETHYLQYLSVQHADFDSANALNGGPFSKAKSSSSSSSYSSASTQSQESKSESLSATPVKKSKPSPAPALSSCSKEISLERYQELNPGSIETDYLQYLSVLHADADSGRPKALNDAPFPKGKSPSSSSSSSSALTKVEENKKAGSSSSATPNSAQDSAQVLSWDPFFSLIDPSSAGVNFSILDMVAKTDKSYFEKFPEKYSFENLEKQVDDSLNKGMLFPHALTRLVSEYVGGNILPKEVLTEAKAKVDKALNQFQAKATLTIRPEFLSLQVKITDLWDKYPDAFHSVWRSQSWSMGPDSPFERSVHLKYAMNLMETDPYLVSDISILGWNLQQHGMLSSTKLHPIMEAFPSAFEADKHRWDLKSFEQLSNPSEKVAAFNKLALTRSKAPDQPGFPELNDWDAPPANLQSSAVSKQPIRSSLLERLDDSDYKKQFSLKGVSGRNYSKESVNHAAQILNKILGLWKAIYDAPIRSEFLPLQEQIRSMRWENSAAFHLNWTKQYSAPEEFAKEYLLKQAMVIREDFTPLAFNVEELGSHWPVTVTKHPLMINYPSAEQAHHFNEDIETYKSLEAIKSEVNRKKTEQAAAEQAEFQNQQALYDEAEKNRVEQARTDDKAQHGIIFTAIKGWFGAYTPKPFKK